jgi:bisphosphoglycerate-independent phosphoglycerate mutase (AlkP superfamily)
VYDAVVHADADRYDAVYEGLRLSYDAGYVDASLKPVVLGAYGGVSGELALQMPSPSPAWTWRSEDLAVLVGLRGEAFRQLVSALTRTGLPDAIAERLTIRGRPVVAFEPENVTSFVAVDASLDIAVVFPDPPQWTVDAPFAERRERRLGVATPGRRPSVEGWFRGGSSAEGVAVEEVEDGAAAIARAVAAVTAGDAAFIVVGAGAADAAAIARLADVVKQQDGLLVFAAGDGTGASGCLAAGAAELPTEDDGNVADVAPTILEWLGVTAPDGLGGRSLLRGRRTS